jgi:hypothetical protein
LSTTYNNLMSGLRDTPKRFCDFSSHTLENKKRSIHSEPLNDRYRTTLHYLTLITQLKHFGCDVKLSV